MKKLLLLLIIPLLSFGQENIVDFFNSIYNKNKKNIYAKYQKDYLQFCAQNNLNLNSKKNEEVYYKLYFMHKLFTTNESMDCSANGILEIPYFWKDSRDYISAPDNAVLRDRTPEVFLSDLVSNKPRYSYECEVGEKEIDFYTFGWCAEREMSFVALLKNMGISAKVVANGGHAWTEIIVELDTHSESTSKYIVKIDNTYDDFLILNNWTESNSVWEIDTNHHLEKNKCSEYNYDCAFCLMHVFYNPKSNQLITNIIVENDASNRINNQIIDGLLK